MIFGRALIFFLLLTSFSLAQTPVPISLLKNNKYNGEPNGIGQTFTISGIITCSNQFGSNGPGAIQDNSAAVSIFGNGFISKVHIGDSVTITGQLSQYNGLTELNAPQTASVIIHSQTFTPDPEVVTINDVLTQQWNGFERLEGKLLRINNVTINGSGNFSGGTSGNNYNITDNTGTLQMRIDESVNIIGTPIPSGTVDLIGILGQFDSSAPYSTGYQLFPRFISDIIYPARPIILPPVTAAEIDSNSFTAYYNTANKGNSEVKYGLTSDLELVDIIIDEDTTFHKVKIEGLQPSRIYYFKAYSTNSVGTSESDLQSVFTITDDTITGTINIYFNFSVDSTIALPGNNATGNVNFAQKLIERINKANYSIDLALYSFDNQSVADALILAKNRGVKVRVVYDSRNTQNSIQALINNGIGISRRQPDLDGIMHNKFFVFDARDTIPANDWVCMGSWNVTNLEAGWKNNVVEINDPAIASAYTFEFQEMWGSTSDTINTANAKFSFFKSDNTPHTFLIGGRDVELYFSPSDRTTSKIIKEVQAVNHSMYLAMYTFTRDDINSEIFSRYNLGAKDIRAIIDQSGEPSSEFNALKNYAEVFANSGATLHSKYAVFDPQYSDSNPAVLTGSHNWTNAAENDNDENTLIIHDYLIANQYLQEFKKRYNEVGGTGTFIIPVTGIGNKISEFKYNLYQNYPNPFNPVTTIRFEVPSEQRVELKIFDILGREVKTLYDNFAPAGIVAVDFTAGNLASGIYIYRIKADNFVSSKKLILIK